MTNKKADNQWYGKAGEIAIANFFNKDSLDNPYPDHVDEKDWKEMVNDASLWLNQFEKITGIYVYSCKWTGEKTGTENGDLIINDTICVEVKRVEGDGKGTYGGTSWNRLRDNYGVPIDSSKYLKDTGLGKMLKEYFGDIVNLDNDNPMAIKVCEAFKKKNGVDKKFSNAWKALDKKCRKKAVENIVEFLKDNPDITKTIASDIASKNICKKETPDYYVVWSKKDKKITYLYDKANIISLSTNYDIKTTKQGLGWYIGPFKLNLRWGNEFTNPAVTIFI